MLSTILFFVWIALPLGAWMANLFTGKRVHPALLYVVTGLFGYFVLIASVWALDVQLEAKMNSFDLDGDGGFSGTELTPEAERAMDEWASDTGRNFAPFSGIPITAIWYTLLFAVVYGGEYLFRSLFLCKRNALPAEA
jgi:hypothetical protein